VSSSGTRWTIVLGAAAGTPEERETFARRYRPAVEAYFGARWRHSPLQQEAEDAVQEVFFDCFREDGALARVDPERPGGFRAFLYGVMRFVALRFEERRARRRETSPPSGFDPVADEERVSVAFDRAWARLMLDQAAQLQEERARRAGPDARMRVDLLRLRFQHGLPIREISRRWNADAKRLHRQYEKAREEFRRALLDVVAAHHPGTPGEVEREAARLAAFFS